MTITRERLRSILNNVPAMSVIKAKSEIDEVRQNLRSAIYIMRDAGVEELAIEAASKKLDEYNAISKAYDALLADTFRIRWQDALVAESYLDIAGDSSEINRLPEMVPRR